MVEEQEFNRKKIYSGFLGSLFIMFNVISYFYLKDSFEGLSYNFDTLSLMIFVPLFLLLSDIKRILGEHNIKIVENVLVVGISTFVIGWFLYIYSDLIMRMITNFFTLEHRIPISLLLVFVIWEYLSLFYEKFIKDMIDI